MLSHPAPTPGAEQPPTSVGGVADLRPEADGGGGAAGLGPGLGDVLVVGAAGMGWWEQQHM